MTCFPCMAPIVWEVPFMKPLLSYSLNILLKDLASQLLSFPPMLFGKFRSQSSLLWNDQLGS
jgi:hypothetical protein